MFDGVKSGSFDLRFGVAQGGCLGQLLFVVYTTKLFETKEAQLPDAHCVTDDSQLHWPFKPNSPTNQAQVMCTIKPVSDIHLCQLGSWFDYNFFTSTHLSSLIKCLARDKVGMVSHVVVTRRK